MTFNFVDYVVIFSGVLVCLRRIAQMESYHTLRVVVLTMILSFFVILFFLSYGFSESMWEPPFQYISINDGHFRCSEM